MTLSDLYKGRILSTYDFLITTPFTDYDGVERAYAHGANGVEYWVFPTRRMPQPRRMYESIQQRIEQIITETVNSYINRECRLVG